MRVSKALGAGAYAVYLTGGATGRVLKELVPNLYVPGNEVAGGTGTNFTVVEEISGLEYRFASGGFALLKQLGDQP